MRWEAVEWSGQTELKCKQKPMEQRKAKETNYTYKFVDVAYIEEA